MLDGATIEGIIIELIHKKTGWGALSSSEHEEVSVDTIIEQNDKVEISFMYYYNENQSAKGNYTHVLEGEVIINAKGAILSEKLSEIYTGTDCKKAPLKK